MSDPLYGRKTDGTFGPGNHGGGRPKMPEDLKLAFQARTQDALNTLVHVMLNGVKDSDRVKASDSILDRAWGKAAQTIDGNINTGVRLIDTEKLTKDQLDTLALIAVSNMNLSEDIQEHND